MECAAGGFRELRRHVKAMKGSSPQCEPTSFDTDEIERSELGGVINLDLCKNTQQCNQDGLWRQEKQVHALFAAATKEQQLLKARERNIRAIENTLNEEMARVAEKSENLDVRILEITRLEARLHEALLQQEQTTSREPQEAEPILTNSDIVEREAVLDLRKKEIMIAKARIDGKEKHIQAKERILDEKEVELVAFQKDLERKDRERQYTDKRLKLLEKELLATHAQQMAILEDARTELGAQRAHLDEREAAVAYRERATKAQAVALNQFQQIVSQEHERSLLAQEDYLARGLYLQEEIIALKTQKHTDYQEQHTKPPSAETQQTGVQSLQLKRKGTLRGFFKSI